MADAILVTNPDDWLALEMHFMKFEADMKNYPQTMYKTSTMNKIRELIDSDPNFGFYEVVLNDFLAIRSQIDGDTDEQLRCIERGVQIAKKFDDKLRWAHLLIQKGSLLMNSDRKKSRAALQQAYQIAESTLNIPAYYSNIVYYLSLLDATRGEFDEAIDGCLKAITIRERIGLEMGNASSFLSIFYNMIGEPESGLEWGRMAEEHFSSRPYLINLAILFQIWSLILLERLIEAQALLDSLRESIFKSGYENQLAWFHFVSGILETKYGNLDLAIGSIEQGLEIFEHHRTALLNEFIFMYHLAKIEILSSHSENVVSPSLVILEEKARSEDSPGFLGLALLLRADIAISSNDETLLREIIPQLRILIDTGNLMFLKSHFDKLLGRL